MYRLQKIIFTKKDSIRPLLWIDNLSILKNGLSVIVGPNGSGKSLLLKLLHGLIKENSGNLLYNNRNITQSHIREIAMVMQKPILLRRSVLENLKFIMKLVHSWNPNEAALILDRFNLANQKSTPARLLSGGEQQRLALARAICKKPKVLLMDEPTANTDPISTQSIEKIIVEEMKLGTKIILVTHDLGQAKRLASDIIFMHNGKILEHTETRQFFIEPKSTEAKQYISGDLII